MFPPVPTLTREAERDMDLGKYRVQKGEMLGVAVFSMHNNPAYWQARACAHALPGNMPCLRLRPAVSATCSKIPLMISACKGALLAGSVESLHALMAEQLGCCT